MIKELKDGKAPGIDGIMNELEIRVRRCGGVDMGLLQQDMKGRRVVRRVEGRSNSAEFKEGKKRKGRGLQGII